jgi:MoxR-like ATPase
MEGTYALPEAQRDRFMMRVSMGYPDAASEALMLRQRDTLNPLDDLRPVVGADRVRQLIAWARGVHVSPAVEEYAVGLARATRAHPEIRLGASPRATLQLVRAAKVWAALDGREFVIPDDVATLIEPVFAHRMIAARGSSATRGRSAADAVSTVLRSIVSAVRVPLATR